MDDFNSIGEYRSSEKSSATVAVTFLLVGLGIGAIAALLLAPKSGKQIRKMVRRRYEDAKDGLEDLGGRAGDYWEKGSEWANNQKERVAPIMRKMKRD